VHGSNVEDGATSVARDVRLLVAYDGDCTLPDAVLLRDGTTAVDVDVTHGATTLPAGWVSVKPRAPLDAKASYSLKVSSNRDSATIGFQTGDDLAATNTKPPTARIVSSAFTSAATSDGFASATIDLELTPSVPTAGGTFFLDNVPGVSFDYSATDLAFDRGRPSVRVTLNVQTRTGYDHCYTATYEDVAGRASEPAPAACGTVSGSPLPAPAPAPAPHTSAGGGGCSVDGGRAPSGLSAIVALALVGLARRRRPRRA
jgi:MYXO-CTERM domain-containing protein